MKSVEIAFKKLLGKGRAFKAPLGFMSEFLDLLASPFAELKDYFLKLKYTHFPTINVDKNDIVNGEELFGIKEIEGMTLEERAANVESQWSSFAGCQTFKQIETILRKKGYPVKIIENIPQNYNTYGARLIGNGFIITQEGKDDPIKISNGKHTFIVQSESFYNEADFLKIVEAVAKNKPGHNSAYFIPRYLRKKEIHGKMTKNEMQALMKKCYCDCRTVNEH
mgnify:FL=1